MIGYCRVSEFTQVSSGSLETQKRSVLNEVRELGLHMTAFVYGREYGKLSEHRPHLRRAIALARKQHAGIVAADLTRLLRSEAFDKEANWQAVPTPKEMDALLSLADGVPFLATIVLPDTSPAELHRLATKRGMEQAIAEGRLPGRPSSISDQTAPLLILDRGNGLSLGKLAERYGLSKGAVERFFKRLDRGSARGKCRR